MNEKGTALIVDVSGQRGDYDWILFNQNHEAVANGMMTCDGIAWVEMLEAAEKLGIYVERVRLVDPLVGGEYEVDHTMMEPDQEYPEYYKLVEVFSAQDAAALGAGS